jgi:hypothetical protein
VDDPSRWRLTTIAGNALSNWTVSQSLNLNAPPRLRRGVDRIGCKSHDGVLHGCVGDLMLAKADGECPIV